MMKCTVEYKDLLDFHFLAAPAVSPDGAKIAYKVSRADAEKNGYDTDIWIYSLADGTNRRLTQSGTVKFFCWSDDSLSVIFAAGDGPTAFRSAAVDGGGENALFELPNRATEIRDIGSGRFLITAEFEGRQSDNPENASFMTFDQVPFMSNGRGYTGSRRVGLGIYDLAAGAFRRLTPATMDVSRVTLSKSRRAALIVACDYAPDGVMPLDNDVYKLDTQIGDCVCLTSGSGCTFGGAAWLSGDENNNVIVSATDHGAYGVNENPKIYCLDGGDMYCLTPDMDVSIGHPVAGDTSYGCAMREGEISSVKGGVVFAALSGFKCRLYCLGGTPGNPPYGAVRRSVLTASASSVTDYFATDDRIAYVAYQDLRLPELFLLEDGRETRLTSFNDEFTEGRVLSQPIHVSVKLRGATLDGWYMRPVRQPGRGAGKFPTILNIHGGPKAAFGDIYYHEMQCWAARGYAVIYCNPRGSDGRGGEFADIRGQYGETDYRDIMDFTDWCVKKLDFVDAARLCVTGGSYGGYMTNWIITQTNRFCAAVSQRGIANWLSKFGGCDIGYYYVEDQHLGTPWLNPGNPWRDSPVACANNAATPTLFIHSSEDFRCELNQAFQMFTALKVNGVEARLCVFEGENHELSRSGKPRNRLARLRIITEWFDAHIGSRCGG